MRYLCYLGWLALGASLACSGSDDWADPGPSVRTFESTQIVDLASTALLIVVVDDRATPDAAELRSGIGAAVRQIGTDVEGSAACYADPAVWHPVDLRVLLVPASAPSTDAIVSSATDAALAWTTVQATAQGADAFAAAVDAAVGAIAETAGGSFRPLERARDVVQLVTGRRSPASEAETRLAAIAAARRWTIGVSIVAASDDESPDPPESYWVGDETTIDAVAGLVTPGTDGFDATKFPRLAAWGGNRMRSPVGGCYQGASDPPFVLFPEHCGGHQCGCGGHAILQTSPGLGLCKIEIATFEGEGCSAGRGWIDPMDADGVRRPRTAIRGRVCEVLPVPSASMNACVHDPACTGCTSGWCVTQALPRSDACRAGSMPSNLRWVGGALPGRGSVHVACVEDTQVTR